MEQGAQSSRNLIDTLGARNEKSDRAVSGNPVKALHATGPLSTGLQRRLGYQPKSLPIVKTIRDRNIPYGYVPPNPTRRNNHKTGNSQPNTTCPPHFLKPKLTSLPNALLHPLPRPLEARRPCPCILSSFISQALPPLSHLT